MLIVSSGISITDFTEPQKQPVRVQKFRIFWRLVIGILAFVAYSWLGLPHALLLAIIAGLFAAVPVLGAVLGTAPAIIVGLSISPLTAVWVVVAAAIITFVANLQFPLNWKTYPGDWLTY